MPKLKDAPGARVAGAVIARCLRAGLEDVARKDLALLAVRPVKPARIWLHVAILAALGICVAVPRAAFPNWYSKQANKYAISAAVKGGRAAQETWRRLQYSDVTKPDFFARFAARIEWDNLEISEVQRSRLREKLNQVILYLKEPQLETCYQLKTEALHYKFAISPQALYWLTNVTRPPSSLPGTPKAVTESLWIAVHSRGNQLHSPRLTSVCLDQIAATISHTNTPWSLLKGPVAKPFTKAAEFVNPGFTYFPQTESTAAAEGDFFQLSFFAKFVGSDDVGPVFICLSWSPLDQNWAPSRMLADHWLHLNSLF